MATKTTIKKKIDKSQEDYMCKLISENTHFSLVREYRFHPVRRWRFDCALPEPKIAFECNGGVWVRGAHIRPQGYEKDLEKYNTATLMGWKVYKFTPRMLNLGWIEKILNEDKISQSRSG